MLEREAPPKTPENPVMLLTKADKIAYGLAQAGLPEAPDHTHTQHNDLVPKHARAPVDYFLKMLHMVVVGSINSYQAPDDEGLDQTHWASYPLSQDQAADKYWLTTVKTPQKYNQSTTVFTKFLETPPLGYSQWKSLAPLMLLFNSQTNTLSDFLRNLAMLNEEYRQYIPSPSGCNPLTMAEAMFRSNRFIAPYTKEELTALAVIAARKVQFSEIWAGEILDNLHNCKGLILDNLIREYFLRNTRGCLLFDVQGKQNLSGTAKELLLARNRNKVNKIKLALFRHSAFMSEILDIYAQDPEQDKQIIGIARKALYLISEAIQTMPQQTGRLILRPQMTLDAITNIIGELPTEQNQSHQGKIKYQGPKLLTREDFMVFQIEMAIAQSRASFP